MNFILVPRDVRTDLSDSQLLEWIKDNLVNGLYCESVCRVCGLYRVSPSGDTSKATIHTECPEHTVID